MAIYLKQSTASQEVCLGYFVDSTDGNTEETGLTIANTDIKLHKAGATTLANKNSGGATHISNGIYYAVLDATDTDTLGPLVIYCHPTGALAVRVECCVLTSQVYDSIIAGTDLLQVDTTQVGGTAQTAGDIIGDTNDIQTKIGTPAGASVSADVAAVKTQTAAIETDTGTDLPATLATIAGYLDTEIAAIKAKTDNLPSDPADQSAVEAAILAAWTTAVAESYRANGAAGTPAQLLYEAIAHLGESEIAGTTKTLKKLDHSTTAATFTLDDAATPTSITRAT